MPPGEADDERLDARASLTTVATQWTRIGLTGFGGPPAHIALLRELVVDREGWMDAREFQDANAACGLLPGPASTQLAIFCAYRLAGPAGAIIGGIGFIAPAVIIILALAIPFLARSPPDWIQGAGEGAGAAVAAVALQAGRALIAPSLARVRGKRSRELQWLAYVLAGAAGAALLGAYLVLVLLGCGLLALVLEPPPSDRPAGGRTAAPASPAGEPDKARSPLFAVLAATVHAGSFGSLVWTALKVGALSFGGGFVIIPLMQGDAVHTYHWMTNAQFLNAVALGQVTPGPVVATVAAVGYAAHGLLGGLIAALVAFSPSFSFILIAGPRFERLRGNRSARAFLDGAGPAAIGAILGSAVLLASALQHGWQFVLLALAILVLLVLRRGVVETLLGAGALGVVAVLAGL